MSGHDVSLSPMRAGRVAWIGVQTQPNGWFSATRHVEMSSETGLDGDCCGPVISLMQYEHVAAIWLYMDFAPPISISQFHCHFVAAEINLLGLKGRRFGVGDAVLEYLEPWPLGQEMEALLGLGGYNAATGHSSITARIVQSGRAKIGSAVSRIDNEC